MNTIDLYKPITELNFGCKMIVSRMANFMNANGIMTIGQLCHCKTADLSKIDQIGSLTVARISAALEELGLHLNMNDNELKYYQECHLREMAERAERDAEEGKIYGISNPDVQIADSDIVPEHCREKAQTPVAEKQPAVEEKPIEQEQPDEQEEPAEQEQPSDADEYSQHLDINIHNYLHKSESDTDKSKWDDRFYEVAKEEYLRQNHTFNSEEARAERALFSASIFIEAVKACQSREKSNK